MAGVTVGENGIAALIGVHRRELLAFLAARCGDPTEAEDVLQELWLKLADAPTGPIGNGRAYLFRAANNLVLDRLRSRKRAMQRDRSWLGEGLVGAPLAEDRSDPAPRADEALLWEEEAQMLRKAIAGLPPGARRALELHRLEGHGQAEVARIMGISLSGVEKHLATAMRHLRQALAGCGYFTAATSSRQGQSKQAGSTP